MRPSFLQLSAVLAVAAVAAVAAVDITVVAAVEPEDSSLDLVRAASRTVNCGCQCSNTVFKDKYGKVNGNCVSTDKTGAVWCYVDPSSYSSCSDLQKSERFNKYWSYEACATPALDSYECRNGGFNGGYNGLGNGYNGGSNGFNNGYNGGSSGFNSGYNGGSSGFNNGYNGGSSGFNNGYNGGSSGFNNGYNGGSSGFNSGYNGGSIGSGLGSNSYSSGAGLTLEQILSQRKNKDAVTFG